MIWLQFSTPSSHLKFYQCLDQVTPLDKLGDLNSIISYKIGQKHPLYLSFSFERTKIISDMTITKGPPINQ